MRWDDVDPDLRRQVHDEATALYRAKLRDNDRQLAELDACEPLPFDHSLRRNTRRRLLERKARLERCYAAAKMLA